VEFQSITGILKCDDDTLPADSRFQQFSDLLRISAEKFGTPITDPLHWKEWFEARGFESVTEVVLKVPCNQWPQDPRLKLVGTFEMYNLLQNLDGMTMKLFKTTLGWSSKEVAEFAQECARDIQNTRYHTYWP